MLIEPKLSKLETYKTHTPTHNIYNIYKNASTRTSTKALPLHPSPAIHLNTPSASGGLDRAVREGYFSYLHWDVGWLLYILYNAKSTNKT